MWRQAICFWFAATGGAALAAEPKPAMPLGDPGEWITSGDYPASALIDGSEGTVTFALSIDTLGRVQDCSIIQSSGSDLLDATACNLITQRARFSVARDVRGRETSGSYRNRVRWVLPSELPQPRPMVIEGSFIVEADGTPSDCRLLKTEGVAPEELAKIQSPCVNAQTTVPFTDENGNPVRRLVRMRSSISIEPVP